jgi:succinate dehydrogenase / fumarate reductase cytochrome b subunit
MALTGLFLIVFLIVHLAGNFQLLLTKERAEIQFNIYSKFMTVNPLIKAISYLLYASFIAHIVVSVVITIKNQKAAGRRYAYDRRKASSRWFSRNMGILGTIILVFLIIHMRDFWYQYRFGNLPMDAEGNKDMFTIVVTAFGQWWYVLLYVVSMIALGFHLLHGFTSAFKTLGLFPARLSPIIYYGGMGLTLILTAGFIIIPLFVFFNYHI